MPNDKIKEAMLKLEQTFSPKEKSMDNKLEATIDAIKSNLDVLESLVKTYGVVGKQRHDCLVCHSWDNSLHLCGKYNAVPPPKVIIVGCPVFVYDEIPF